MRRRIITLFGVIALSAMITACSTTPKSEEERGELKTEASGAMTKFRQDREVSRQIDNAYGYAVFPEIGKGGAIVGGSGGRGLVYEHGTPIGYATMSQATVGLQLGGQQFSELILFENKAALDRFTRGEWAATAQATAVAAESGAAANAKYKEGVMVFVTGQKGLMGEAAVGGQKFNYQPMK